MASKGKLTHSLSSLAFRYDWNLPFGYPQGSTSYHTSFSGHHFLRVFQPNPYVLLSFSLSRRVETDPSRLLSPPSL